MLEFGPERGTVAHLTRCEESPGTTGQDAS